MKKIELMKKKLESEFKPRMLEIVDESKSHIDEETGERARAETFFYININSPRFEKVSPTQRHKMIKDALNEIMRGKHNRLEIRAVAPEDI